MPKDNEDLPTIVAQAGPLNGQRWMLKDSLVIGRDHTCDVVVADRQVSRYHARFTITADGALLEDMGSKNGTHCNGQPINDPVIVQDGDIIQIALAQQFVYLSSDATVPLDASFQEPADFIPQARHLHLDKRSRRVWIKGKELLPPLSVSQFQLLEILFDSQGRVVTRDELVQAVWSKDDAVGVTEQALDALVRRLRDRLAAIDPTQVYLVTVRGHGLRLENPPLRD
jgi:DNA-binding winged helix-turn-helix (wHTH) protein